jgi:hypothetical protein
MEEIRSVPMSTATPSPPTFGLSRVVERTVGLVVDGVQALAFWTAALLPLLLVAGLFAGVADQHLGAVGGALLVNVFCAVVGHGHSPN